MTKTIFEEMGGTYRQVGDYYFEHTKTSLFCIRKNRLAK
jgi:hypothetical protein